MGFDARQIKLLEDGRHLTSEEHPGLRIEARGDIRTWSYRYRSPIDDSLRQIKIGRWPEVSLHAAITKWEEYRKQRNAGRDPADEAKATKATAKAAVDLQRRQSKAKAYTVRDVAIDYWTEHVERNRQDKGAAEILRMFNKMLGALAGEVAVTLTRTQAFELIGGHAAKIPVQAGTLRRELAAAWDHAIDAGRLPDTTPNHWRSILRGKVKSKGKKIEGKHIGTAKRVLSPAEAGELILWLPNFTQLIEDALTQYLWTCTRGVEILGMEGREVQQEGAQWWWTIPKAKTKNARIDGATDLRVPLFGRALAVVMRRKKLYGEGFLYPAKRRDGTIGAVEQKTIQSTVWTYQPYSQTTPEWVRPRLPVTYWAPHDLRRTSRTFLASLGCPGEVGEAILGHMLPGVEGVYNQYKYDAERVEWLRRLSEYLEELAATSVS